MLYLINPKRRTKRMARGKKRRTPAQRRATARMIAANRARRRKKSTRKRTTRKTASNKRRATVARKRRVTRKRTTKRRRTTRGRRRSSGNIRLTRVKGKVYRSNPGISLRNIGGTVFRGVKDGATVVAGKAATRIVSGLLPLPKDGVMGIAVQGVSAIIVGLAGQKFLGRDAGRLLLAGGFAAPIESFAKGLPVVGAALSDDYGYSLPVGEYPMIGEYPDMAGVDLPVGEYVYT